MSESDNDSDLSDVEDFEDEDDEEDEDSDEEESEGESEGESQSTGSLVFKGLGGVMISPIIQPVAPAGQPIALVGQTQVESEESEGEPDEEGEEELKETKSKTPAATIKNTLLTTTAKMPSMAELLAASKNPVQITAASTKLKLGVPTPVQFGTAPFTGPTSPPVLLSSPQVSMESPTLLSTSIPLVPSVQGLMTPSTFGMAAPVITASGIPGTGTGAPNLPKVPTPKKLPGKTLNYTKADLSTLRNDDLKCIAKSPGVNIKGFSGKNKDAIIDLLLNNPIKAPVIIKVTKGNSEEDVTILPTSAVPSATISPKGPLTIPTTVQIPISTVMPENIPHVLLQNPVLPSQPSSAIGIPGLVIPTGITLPSGSIGALPSSSAAPSLSLPLPPEVPISLKDLLAKRTGESVELQKVREKATEEAVKIQENPQIAANIGAAIVNQASLNVKYNPELSTLMSNVKL